MHTKIMLAAVAAAAAAIPLAASAYDHGKPGLWEDTTQMTFTKGGPQIPPDKLAMMKQMGIQIPGMGPVITQVCVTPEQAATNKPPVNDQHQCQLQNLKQDGKTFSADMVCSGDFTGTGHFSVTYDSDEHFTGTTTLSGTSQRSGAVEMKNDMSGQFKSADCGAVKPVMPRGQ